jgi:N-acetylmuramoyl-L-alanine amidase
MVFFPRLSLLLAFLLGLTTALSPGSARALDVLSVRMGPHPDKTRIVIELDQSAPFRSFMLADPVRLVIDMPVFNWRAGSIARPAGTGVTDIRQGPLQPGYSRIAIDLSHPSLIQSAFLIPRRDGQPHRLVLDIARTDAEKFTRHRSITHGTLQIGDTAGMTQASLNIPAVDDRIAGNIAPAPASKPPQGRASQKKPLIVIDAGHGGNDPGALGAHGLKEKNITLAMAYDLKKSLEATGRYKAQLTRDKDIFLRLSHRVSIARQKKADLFISLHADSINRAGVRGASIYTLSETASDAESEKLAARENLADAIAGLDLSHEDEDVANILVDLAMRDTMNQSKFFANKTIGNLKKSGVRVLDNGHRYAGFAVLKAPDIPSVLIELGYMSNAQESTLLSQPEYRGKIATALVDSIDGYFATLSQ